MRIDEIENEKIIKEDYFSVKAISATSLSWFEQSPIYYKKKIDAGSYKKTKYMELGTAIHMAVMEPTKFKEEYVRCIGKIGAKMGVYAESFADVLIGGETEEVAHEIAYIKSEFVGKPESIAKKFDEDRKIQKYVDFLRKNSGKIIMNEEDWSTVEICRNSILQHKKATWFFDESDSNFEHFVEQEIYWSTINLKGIDFDLPLKSKLDKIVVDKVNGIIYFPDIKSTSKNVHNYPKTKEFIRCIRQLSFYCDALKRWSKERYGKVFTIVPYLIVVQTTDCNETVVYALGDSYMLCGRYGGKVNNTHILGYGNLLKEIKWHTDNNQWNYPRSYYEGDGVVELNLKDE